MLTNLYPRTLILSVTLLGICNWLIADGIALAVNGSGTRSKSTQPASSYRGQIRARRGEETKNRLREGTKITNRLGRFRQSGDRATFVTKDNVELGGLPNLNLERVVRMLKSVDEPESIWWSVSGLVTEFSGRNYLLIERAVYKSATLPPPEKVDSEGLRAQGSISNIRNPKKRLIGGL